VVKEFERWRERGRSMEGGRMLYEVVGVVVTRELQLEI
jgi:hypothetical protein